MNRTLTNPWILTIGKNTPKRLATLEHLEKHGIKPNLFFGFDFNISGICTTKTYEKDTPGAGYKCGSKIVCMAIGHLMLWKSLWHHPGTEEVFTVLEDDVRLDADWADRFTSAANVLPGDWDMFYPGYCCLADHQPRHISANLFQASYLNCTHCYIVRKRALPILIDRCAAIDSPIDIQMALSAFPHLKIYAIIPRIAYQEGTVLPP